MVYGSRSWVDHCPGGIIQQMRPDSYVDFSIIRGAGHHVYADSKDKFNDFVSKACGQADENDLHRVDPPKSPELKHEDGEDIDLQANIKPMEQQKPTVRQ